MLKLIILCLTVVKNTMYGIVFIAQRYFERVSGSKKNKICNETSPYSAK